MNDLFLEAHCVEKLDSTGSREPLPNFYELNGPRVAMSLRDQMVRGRLIVEQASRRGEINEDRPLLVVGAGAAGIAAAFHAVDKGVPTTLVERAAQLFAARIGTNDRWIDPTQYDWPAEHWSKSIYHWTNPPVQLPWLADHGSALALQLRQTFDTKKVHPLLQYYDASNVYSCTILPSSSGLPFDVAIATPVVPSGILSQSYSMILSCTGTGPEKVQVPGRYGKEYEGPAFWDPDDYDMPDWGIPLLSSGSGIAPPPYALLVSGGGDGALQDFLRLVFSNINTGIVSARDVYQNVTGEVIPGGGPRDAVWDSIERDILRAEEEASRLFAWYATKDERQLILSGLHSKTKKTIDLLKADPQLWTVVEHRMLDLIRDELQPTSAFPARAVLVHRQAYFSRCFALNRFLILLLEAALQSSLQSSGANYQIEILWEYEIQNVEHESSSGSPVWPYNVSLRNTTTNTSRNAVFHTVIVRHGIEPRPLLDGATITDGYLPLTIERPTHGLFDGHLIPYHVIR